MANQLLPIDEEPFKETLKNEKKPFTDFISTPLFVSLKYEHINITVQDDRFQITDRSEGNPLDSPIIKMASKYFEILRYTPLKAGGFNFNGRVEFLSEDDLARMEKHLFSDKKKLCEELQTDNVETSVTLGYKKENMNHSLRIQRIAGNKVALQINLNSEFVFGKDMDSFLGSLDRVPSIYAYFTKRVLARFFDVAEIS
jgi:hypothetical protein